MLSVLVGRETHPDEWRLLGVSSSLDSCVGSSPTLVAVGRFRFFVGKQGSTGTGTGTGTGTESSGSNAYNRLIVKGKEARVSE